ncbi:Guanine nucleotide-binding protein alpha-2 subunit [Didymella keratinophila]|nr:Guanine nucleotide-binding protein alpha-2 subunit [Didymella keratinophila]
MESSLEHAHDLSHQQESESFTGPPLHAAFFVDTEAEERSKAIDEALYEGAESRRNQVNVLPLGAFSMREIVQQLRTIDTDDAGLTEHDISHSHNDTRGVFEHRFHVSDVTINVIDVGLQRCERRKWISQFDNVGAVLFVVDLLCYGDTIVLFDGVVNTSIWCKDTKMILFLSNVSAFRDRVSHTPLGDHMPGFEGADAGQAVEYLLRRFREVNRGARKMYEFCVDPNRAENIELVAAALN